MLVYLNARIVVVEENSFEDQETKEIVNYFTTLIKGDDGKVIKVNSGRVNFGDMEGETGLAEIEVREGDKAQFKLKLKAFQPNEKLDLPEKEIT